MNKTFLICSAFMALVAVSCAVTQMKSSGPINPQYTNLKILPKDINKEQMDSVMHHYTASLNVKCNFCHSLNQETKKMDWASDANKHKLVTRQMMTMTNALNKENFDHAGGDLTLSSQLAVTCYTCHHGAKDPVTIAPKQERK